MATVNPAQQQPPNPQPPGQPPQPGQAPPGEPPAQTPPAAAQQAAPAGENGALPAKFAGTDGTISLTTGEYQQLMADRLKRTELEQLQNDQSEKSFQERQKLLIQLGQTETALAELKARHEKDANEWKSKYETAERHALNREKTLVIKDSLTGIDWVNPAAGRQAAELLGNRFEPMRDPLTQDVVVLDRVSRRPAADVIREWLASEDASHLLRPKSAPGGRPNPGNTQADQHQPSPPPAPPENETFEQAVIRHWKDSKSQVAANPLDWRGNILDSAKARRQ